MPLTDIQIQNAKPGFRPVKLGSKDQRSASPKAFKATGRTKGKDARSVHRDDPPQFIETDKPYKMADGAELYLEIDPSGERYWRFKYRRTGKEKLI
jgi:hypothetical protein